MGEESPRLRLRLLSLQYESADIPGRRCTRPAEADQQGPSTPEGQRRFKLRSSGFMVFLAAAPAPPLLPP